MIAACQLIPQKGVVMFLGTLAVPAEYLVGEPRSRIGTKLQL